MFAAVTFKTQICCKVFTSGAREVEWLGREHGAEDLERQGKPGKRLVAFKYNSWLGEIADNKSLSDNSTVLSNQLLM